MNWGRCQEPNQEHGKIWYHECVNLTRQRLLNVYYFTHTTVLRCRHKGRAKSFLGVGSNRRSFSEKGFASIRAKNWRCHSRQSGPGVFGSADPKVSDWKKLTIGIATKLGFDKSGIFEDCVFFDAHSLSFFANCSSITATCTYTRQIYILFIK